MICPLPAPSNFCHTDVNPCPIGGSTTTVFSMKQTNALPSWADDGAANVRSAKFQELSFSLDVTLGALAGATAAAAERPGTYPEVLQLFARGQDLVKTLRTICRAHLGLSAADTAAVKARGDIGHKAAELNKLVEPIFRDLAERASNDPIFTLTPNCVFGKRLDACAAPFSTTCRPTKSLLQMMFPHRCSNRSAHCTPTSRALWR